ncbi:MAG: hypothetical protein ISS66_18615 [Desulfobacteraceae bacterium]|nr:hypothetical protein [Desulfobacteraceae bacterium]
MTNPVVISAAVEGILDEVVLRRLIESLGAFPGSVYGKNGKSFLLEKLNAYNQAARFFPWVILIDLDHDADCAPPFLQSCLPNPAPYMNFRVAVREIEAWLLADRERLSKFLSVGASRIPHNPEILDSPKLTMVEIAGHSRRRDVRENMVPRAGSGRKIGPAYTSLLIEFARDPEHGWRPNVAAKSSDSLDRCMRRLEQLIGGAK